MKRSLTWGLLGCLLALAINVRAVLPAGHERLPDLDRRRLPATRFESPSIEQVTAAAQLRQRLPNARVDFDDVTASPKLVSVPDGFLSGPRGGGKAVSPRVAANFSNQPHGALKAFLQEHRSLFGYGPEALTNATAKREFVTPHNGLSTVVWQQQVDGIPVFEGVLVAHTTRAGELVNLSSQFLPEPVTAANSGTPGRAALQVRPTISAGQAVALAAQNVGAALTVDALRVKPGLESGAEQRTRFTAAQLKGESEAKLVWLPLNSRSLRLCWDVVLMSKTRGEMFRSVVDAQTGEVLVRRCLTEHLAEATYRVYTSDSPSPFSPGLPAPGTNQPPLVARQLVTLSALDTNASPAGWINDGENETKGNNVDAHLDRNADNGADLPRPHGNPFRVFDLPLDLTQSPTTYGDAAVVQLFYLCNWMHDQLYDLGFTEAAGNFQIDNFGRGGLGGDPVQADAQDGSGTDNANMSTPPDGMSPRIQMYRFTGSQPNRDGDLDAEVVLHEYTHGLSNRRVGGGVGISALQTGGMGEGWSDFYALALLSEPGDDVDGTYASGAYVSYRLSGLTQNYYFGIRRYPYSTDLGKNPLTFKDIDPAQASGHAGIPSSPIGGGPANEVHNMGEVWCVTLWEARAALVHKHGFAVGNHLTLQLVTDGMNLSPPNPNFLQARDAILEADQVDTGGANRRELWAAFAKRGMGFSASSPASSTTSGLHEAYDVPDDLSIVPQTGFIASGPSGGPFTPAQQTFVLSNVGTNPLPWAATASSPWLSIQPAAGSLSATGTTTVTVALDPVTASFPDGLYANTLVFSNQVSGRTQSRDFALRVAQRDYFTEFFDGTGVPQNTSFTFTPDGSPNFYSVSQAPATNFPTVPDELAYISPADPSSQAFTLSGFNTVSLYGYATNVLFISPSGTVTFIQPDTSGDQSYTNHFRLPRISALVSDLYPGVAGGTVYCQEMADRVALTFQKVYDYSVGKTSSFQVELFFDGRLRLTYLEVGTTTCLIGLSAGTGLPADFAPSRFGDYGAAQSRLLVTVPAAAREGQGQLAMPGTVGLPAPLTSNLTVNLLSALPGTVVVPATVVIPAGATNAAFAVTVNDDHLLSGTRRVAVSGSADSFGSGSAVLTLQDAQSATLSLRVPAIVREGDGVLSGTLTVSAPPANGVLVNLSSSDSTEIQVPPFAIIPAGQTSTVFSITVVDDHEIDGPRGATLAAAVDNWLSGQALITVLDSESTNLVVSLPPNVTEGQGTRRGAGTVSISGTLGAKLVVNLASSAPSRIAVPASVTIPAGQTSAAFDLTVLDDALVEGLQTATITARASGFANGSSSLQIWDDEIPPAPVLRSPANWASGIAASNTCLTWNGGEGELAVNGGFEAGSFDGWHQDVSGWGGFAIATSSYEPYGPAGSSPPYAGTYYAVSTPLGPSHSELYQDFTIPAGVLSATLSWADRIRNFATYFGADQYYRVEIRTTNDALLQVAFTTKPGDPLQTDWTARSFDLSAYMGSTIRVAFVEEANPYFMNIYLDSVSLELGAGAALTQYAVYFGTNSALGATALLGTTTNTTWPLPLLAPQTTYYWQIVSQREGQTASALWQFTTRGVDHFDWNTVASPQLLNQPFGVSLAARDEFGRPVPNFTNSVSLFAVANSSASALFADDFEDGDLSDWSPGSGTYTRTIDSQVAAVGTHSLTLSGGNGYALNGLSHTFSNLMPSCISFYVRGSSSTAAGGYFVIGDGRSLSNFVAFFLLENDGTMGLYEEQGGWHGVPYEANRWYKISLALDWDARQLDYYVNERLVVAGIPFRGAAAASVNQLYLYNYDNTQAWWDEIQFLNGPPPAPLALTPSCSANFTNGVWSGAVTVLEPADSLHLLAQDDQGHVGIGNNFAVSAPNNLSLAMAASTNLAALGQNLTYTLVASNSGPQAASGVYVIEALPPGVQFVSATNSQGFWFGSGDSVLFELGTLNGSSAATLGIVVAPTNSGSLTNWAAVMGAAPEAYMDDNFAQLATLVGPALSIGDVVLSEGNFGTTNAVFPVTLSSPFTRPIQVSYATTNGNALAGVDYLASAGTLSFAPGTTSNFISVAVIGNLLVESNKQFYVKLSAPANASLPRSQAACTILNDDGLPGNLYTLQWAPIASPQCVNHPFAATLTARDAANQVATNFTGSVVLSAITGTGSTTVGTDASSLDFPMGTFYHDERTQVIYLSSELAGAGRIRSLSLNVATVPGQVLNNWTIRMKHTQLSSYGYNAAWEGDGWTVMLQTNLTVSAAGLLTFYFATPFAYNGVDNLMVDFSFNNSSYTSDGYCSSTYQSAARTLYCQTDSGYGDPLNWSGPSPYGYTTHYTPNIQLQFDSTVPVQPACTDNFTNGVWSGNLSVQGFSPTVTLLADDLNGHTGLSNPFQVAAVNDLALGASVSSNAVPFGQPVTCTLWVTNSGLQPATGILVSNTLPADINLLAATASQGSASIGSNSVVFEVGQLTNGQVATLTLRFQPTRCSVFSLAASVSRNEPEDYLANNSAQIGFSVVPLATISDVAVKEGNTGTTPMAFRVTLSQPSDQPVTMTYYTSDGTAVADTDYRYSSGGVTFNPGVTSAVVRVLILGDTQIEPNETFSLKLISPVNVALARASATGTILNDDGLPGDVFTLGWGPLSSPQFLGQPFAVTLTARDAAGNVATNYNSKAALSAGKEAVHSVSIGTASSENNFPFYAYYSDARTQVIYLTNELGGAGQITSIALNVVDNYDGLSLNNWTVRMKHTPLSSYSTYAWETNGWTTVLRTNLSFSSTGWLVLPLATPFNYNGASNLMVDFSFSDSPGNWAAYCQSTSRDTVRTLYYGTDTSSGDPLSWSGSSPYSYSSYSTPDLRVNFGTLVGCQPAIADHFTNGVWSGTVSVFEIGTNIVLSADDRNGHVSFTAPFVVTPINDISLSVAAAEPLPFPQSLTYTLVVSNTGPSAATGIAVTNILPPSTIFVSASSGSGMFALNDNVAVFTLDNLAPASSATFRLVVNPTSIGTLTNSATVSRNEVDNYPANNAVTTITHVVPTLNIGDVAIVEGNVGTRTAFFPLTLSAAFDQPIQVSYSTANGTATANSDYVAASGTVVFPPGTTTNVIAVTINGDVLIEPDETFYVNLSAPVNVNLARAQAVGTILNDDGLPGDVYSLRWSPVASPQFVNVPFAATLTAWDAANHVASNFNGAVALSATAGIRTNTLGTGTVTLNFPLGASYYSRERTQVIYLRSELGAAGRILGLTLDVATAPPQALANWTIRMKHTPLNLYSNAAWEGSGWTVMVQTNLTVSAAGLLTFRFATPFVYNGTDNLMVDFSFSNAADLTSSGNCRATLQSATRTLYYTTSSYGDPLTWSGSSSPYPYLSSYTPNVRVLFDDAVAVQPALTGSFTNGVWSGLLSLGEARPSLTLLADDLNGHTNVSNPFEVRLANDVAISLSDAPDPLTLSQNLTYTMVVTNIGPLPAQGVTVTNFLPATVNFVSANTSQGTCTNLGSQVVFNLGTLPGPGSAVLHVTVAPTALGILTNVATVSRTDPDAYLPNNTASVTTAVYPSASIAGTSLKEGNVGTTNAIFSVTLSAPYSQTVQLNYATANGTAKAGVDYLSTSGTLLFPAGTTLQTIAVPVVGNTLLEGSKTFVVSLTAVTNVIVSVGNATGTILNDDGLPGDLYTLRWSPVASPQYASLPFAATLTALTASGQAAANFNGSVVLSAGASAGTRTNTLGTGTFTQNFPLGTYYPDERTQVIYLRSELGAAGLIYGLTLDVSTVPGQLLNSWTIRMKHTSLSQYGSSPAWESSGWSVMVQTNLTVSSTGLLTFRFANPFPYNGVDNLMVDFSFNNSSFTSDGYCRATSQSTTRTLYYRSDSGYGDPLTWSGTSPYPTPSGYTPNIRLQFDDPVAVQPLMTGNFTNGVWSGWLTLGSSRTSLTLRADDLNGHTSTSNPFEVRLANDLAIGLTGSPAPLSAGQNLTYRVVVTNNGPRSALGVAVTNFLPASVSFVSATPPATCVSNVVTWRLASLASGSSTNFSVVATAALPGLLTNAATVIYSEPDSAPANNRAQLVTLVSGPEVAVFDDPAYVDTLTPGSTSRAEQACLTNLCFPVVRFTDIASATGSHQQLLFPELCRRDLSADLSPAVQGALSNFVYRGGKLIVHGSSSLGASRLINQVFGCSVQETASAELSGRTAEAAGTAFAGCPALVASNDFVSVLQPATLPPGALNLYTNSVGSSVSLLGFGNGCVIFLGWNWTNAAPVGTQDGGWLSLLSSACLAQPPAPTAPVNLAAAPAVNLVNLSWSAIPAATNYTLKRAELSHGPYTVIASLCLTNYADTAVTGEKPYFYVVSAGNASGESANSFEVSATPHSPPQLAVLFSDASTGLSLAWPAWATNYQVYSSTNLAAPVWQPVTERPQTSNDLLFLSQPITAEPQKFFRLGQP